MRPGCRQFEVIESRAFQIGQSVAADADQVVMPLGRRIETDDRARMTDLDDDTEIGKPVQCTVDSHSRHAGQTSPNLVVDLIDGGMVPTVDDGLEHGPSLARQRDSPLSAKPLQLSSVLDRGVRCL